MTQQDFTARTIDGDTYRILMLDPMTAGDLLVDLIDIFGPSVSIVGSGILKAKDSKEVVAQLLDGINSNESDATDAIGDLVGDNLERAITGLIERMDKAKLREIIRLMCSVTSVQKGEKWPELATVFDIHFRGRIFTMYKWLAAAVRIQYGNFS